MTVAAASVRPRQTSEGRERLVVAVGLLRLELRCNVMAWLTLPAILLFFLDTYHHAVSLPPLWFQRASIMQGHGLTDCAPFVAGAAAWMGSRDARRGTSDLVAITSRSKWARHVVTWVATTAWALAAYLGCAAILYIDTWNRQSWGGPLWWPVAVGAAGVAATSSLGFTAGVLVPGRFTAPLAAVVAFFALTVASIMQNPQHPSPYVLVLPTFNPNRYPIDTAVFYHYVPDLAVVEVLFLIGLTAVSVGVLGLYGNHGQVTQRTGAALLAVSGVVAFGTAIGLAGTARPSNRSSMLTIPALNDAAVEEPIPYRPICTNGSIPVCLNPAFVDYLPEVSAALGPVLNQLAGLPGAPVRVDQVATNGNTSSQFGVGGGTVSGSPPVFRFFLEYLPGAYGTSTVGFVDLVRQTLVTSFAGNGSRAQQAVEAGLLKASGTPLASLPSGLNEPAPGSPTFVAALRFAALSNAARHSWLAAQLSELRTGHVTLEKVP